MRFYVVTLVVYEDCEKKNNTYHFCLSATNSADAVRRVVKYENNDNEDNIVSITVEECENENGVQMITRKIADQLKLGYCGQESYDDEYEE